MYESLEIINWGMETFIRKDVEGIFIIYKITYSKRMSFGKENI